MEKPIYYNKLLDKKGNNKVTRAVKKPDRKQKKQIESKKTQQKEQFLGTWNHRRAYTERFCQEIHDKIEVKGNVSM